MAATRFRLIFHVPIYAAAACKSAIFAAGAGRQGNYSECCFTVVGTGQFRPIAGANPSIGKIGALEEVEEVRIETLCVGEETTKKVVAALKRYMSCVPLLPREGIQVSIVDILRSAHPYEEPSYSVYRLEDF
ncbi:GTP cyclohydrolase 1 type 2/Nif3 [Xylariaceae sp. AK1471]|nr:GTP cyclohydrolase 1 type 2/Nif3 [Xylariaceae sp. AK1471]